MNSRKYFAAALYLSIAFQACAQPPGRFALESVAPTQRAALVSSLQRGTTFTSEGRTYQHLADAQASQAHSDESLSQAASRLKVDSRDLVETKGRYLFFRVTSGAPVAQKRANEPAFPVVLNTGTGQLGLLPGTIAVMLKDTSQAGAVAADHGLQLERAFPHLGVAYLKAGEGQNVLTAAAAVAGDARVTRAEPEVLEHIRVPY